MNEGKTVFSQLMDFLPLHEFRKCVKRYRGHYKVQKFTCYDQFLCMIFAQLTYRNSLRALIVCLKSNPDKLYHMGFRGELARSTLADANEKRDWRIFSDFAQVLITQAKQIYATHPMGFNINHTVYAFDSTTVDLCLTLFPWARFRQHKGAIKLHTLIDLQGNLPVFIHITDGKVHDVKALDELPIMAGSIYVMDRGYLDFARLFRINQQQALFVIRAKSNMKYKRIASVAVDKKSGLLCDQTISVTGFYAKQNYPNRLRRIRYYDKESKKQFTFLTNYFELPALTIVELYRSRWQVELFFKWIKQHLCIKSFYGTSANAVKTQIWIAISAYVLVSIVKKQLKLEESLFMILQVLSINIFEKTPITLLNSHSHKKNKIKYEEDQPSLFDQLEP
jgi:hypothetical protein